MRNNGSIWKRLDAIEKAISLNKERTIYMMGNGDKDDSAAEKALLAKYGVRDEDLVVIIRQFGCDEDADLPRILSIN